MRFSRLSRNFASSTAIARKLGLFVHTPLLQRISRTNNDFEVFYKMDCLQPSGSFKDRGLGCLIQLSVDRGPVSKLVSSSGGNAGYSATTAGILLLNLKNHRNCYLFDWLHSI